MKRRIEDIEKMGLEELEKAALEGKADVPQGLQGRIRERILAREMVQEVPGRGKALRYGAVAAAAVVALALVLAGPGGEVDSLQDTFEDPYMAYAQVEKAFQEISQKMQVGTEIVQQTKPLVHKPLEILSSTTKIK